MKLPSSTDSNIILLLVGRDSWIYHQIRTIQENWKEFDSNQFTCLDNSDLILEKWNYIEKKRITNGIFVLTKVNHLDGKKLDFMHSVSDSLAITSGMVVILTASVDTHMAHYLSNHSSMCSQTQHCIKDYFVNKWRNNNHNHNDNEEEAKYNSDTNSIALVSRVSRIIYEDSIGDYTQRTSDIDGIMKNDPFSCNKILQSTNKMNMTTDLMGMTIILVITLVLIKGYSLMSLSRNGSESRFPKSSSVLPSSSSSTKTMESSQTRRYNLRRRS